ncbi:MAG: hypothetical protein ACSHXK_08845 [Oceanococcus sp.]
MSVFVWGVALFVRGHVTGISQLTLRLARTFCRLALNGESHPRSHSRGLPERHDD